MNSKEIRELIELISRSNFESFELERDGLKLRLVKQPSYAAPPPPAAVAPPVVAPASPPTASETPPVASPEAEPAAGLVEMTSPIVGTFYASPSPGADPFVKVGVRVSKGQTVCIVEAMKVMNEIESEYDGEIVEVLVSNGQPVEFGEVLYRLRPA